MFSAQFIASMIQPRAVIVDKNKIRKALNHERMIYAMSTGNQLTKNQIILKSGLSRIPVTKWLNEHATKHGDYKKTKWSLN